MFYPHSMMIFWKVAKQTGKKSDHHMLPFNLDLLD